MTPLQRFAHNLRDIRHSLGLSQEELGFRAGIHRTEISRLEQFEREPKLQTLIKLATGLGIDIDALCIGIEWNAEAREFSVSHPVSTS